MSQHSRSIKSGSKRVPIVRFQVLKDECDFKRVEIQNLLEKDPTSMRDNQLGLSELAIQIKGCFREYNLLSSRLSARLLDMASVNAAQEEKQTKHSINTDCQLMIKMINQILKESNNDIVSFDAFQSEASVTSSQASSKLREAQLLLKKKEAEEKVVDEQDALQIKLRELEIESQRLARKKERESLKAEVRFLEEEVHEGSIVQHLDNLPCESSVQRTNSYVLQNNRQSENLSNLATINHVPENLPSNGVRQRAAADFVTQNSAMVGRTQEPYFHNPQPATYRDSGPAAHHPQHTVINASQNFESSSNAVSYLLKQQMFKEQISLFSGEPFQFNTWKQTIIHHQNNMNLSAQETVYLIKANTTGKPNKLVQNFLDAGTSNYEFTLRNIWDSLNSRFGSNVKIANDLFAKLDRFPNINEGCPGEKLHDLCDLLRIIQSNMSVSTELQYLNMSGGQRKILDKLPSFICSKWRSYGHNYEKTHSVYPQLHIFIKFLEDQAEEHSNLNYQTSSAVKVQTVQRSLRTFATKSDEKIHKCVYHDKEGHSIQNCFAFKKQPHHEKKKFIKEKGLCFKCIGRHLAKDCRVKVVCETCKGRHSTVMHFDSAKKGSEEKADRKSESVEEIPGALTLKTYSEDDNSEKSCSKTLLVHVRISSAPDNFVRCYCIIDEQSNCTYAHPKLLDMLGIDAPAAHYSLDSLGGLGVIIEGHVVRGLQIKGVNDAEIFNLPPARTNQFLPNTKDEVASPDMIRAIPSLAHLADKFEEIDEDADVLLLLGRNSGKLLGTECYGTDGPFVHQTPVGWALVGSVHPDTDTLPGNNVTLRTQCANYHFNSLPCFPPKNGQNKDKSHFDIFEEYHDDELPAASREDWEFVSKMMQKVQVNSKGNLQMPLPFKKSDPVFPNNRQAVFYRTQSTLNRLKTHQEQLEKCLQIMEKNLSSSHVEIVPKEELNSYTVGKVWWVPVFPVYNSKKGKYRLVFDSSASYQGISLNGELMQGPDYNNPLRGVLERFREGKIGFIADIEAMYHSFHLSKEDRNFVRFFWFDKNDPENKIVEYRATVHIFGNRPSPAIAIMGLRFTTSLPMAEECPEAKNYILNGFYVDDGLGSANTPEEAIKILKDSRRLLGEFNIRLHKIASNSEEVLRAFPTPELAENISAVDFDQSSQQRSLGVTWNLKEDKFLIKFELTDRPFTKRGILSMINSIFDPLGFAAPIVLKGRLIQRKLIPRKDQNSSINELGWDTSLPSEYLDIWNEWKDSLKTSIEVSIPRCYFSNKMENPATNELHVFCDASEEAIGHVLYLRSVDPSGNTHCSFVVGSSKVSPRSATSVPRLELCSAVEATREAVDVTSELSIKIRKVQFYSDSRVVIGYLKNRDKRFSRYVSRRVSLILKSSTLHQWKYIPTHLNPADIATRPHTPAELIASKWTTGPDFLWYTGELPENEDISSENLPETIENVSLSLKTISYPYDDILGNLMKRLSNWTLVKRVVALIKSATARLLDRARQKKGISLAPKPEFTVQEAEKMLIKSAQRASFPEIMKKETTNEVILREDHPLSSLSPILDGEGILRVGGRLRNSNVPFDVKCPILLPKEHRISVLIAQHHHQKTVHQGRHITLSAIRNAGYHIHKGKSLIRKLLSSCVTCRKLRAQFSEQKMADLPQDRLEEVPPFTNVGMDVFGPYHINDGVHTRKTSATKKIWCLIFTCLVSRAVHIECLQSMDTVSFKNALRRFFAIRGTCKILRSDRGTNFQGSYNQDVVNMTYDEVKNETKGLEFEWIFNPVGASHTSGVWERKIGSIKRVLNASLLTMGPRALTRDEFSTLVQEAAAVVNNTPLWEVSSSPDDPCPISPAMLLTLHENPNPAPCDNFTENDILAYGPRRWRRVQYLADQFWSRWRTEYFSNLQHRRKWNKPRSYCTGDVVLVKDKNLKRNMWLIGKISALKPSKDGLVRTVYIDVINKDGKNRTKTIERSVHNIVTLLSHYPT